MRRRIVFLLPFLALVLMGGECEFRAGVNTLPPEKREGERGRDNSGLLVVVNTGGTSSESGDSGVASQTEMVQSALAASVLELPELEPMVALPVVSLVASPVVRRVDLVDLPSGVAMPVVAREFEPASSPVPEPGGLFLFTIGTLLVGWLRPQRGAASRT